ncbi:zf-TFIIB domain-containing protein [Rhodobacteraceae bacterium D3-12]|nr:zf-TFIIB domain-containing protein [Rhodobacteraceae bacterium D3-12]
MKCPIDGETLRMSERHGVEIDYCPSCRGVWLDRGELDKIIDKAVGDMALPDPEPVPEPEPVPQPAPEAAPEPRVWQEPYREARAPKGKRYKGKYSDDGTYRKKKRRKSILEEIFDFD